MNKLITIITIFFLFYPSAFCIEKNNKKSPKYYDVYDMVPIFKPTPTVTLFAKKHGVELFANYMQIYIEKQNNYKGYKKYKKVYPCFKNKEFCTILYKNLWQIRFATDSEINEIYIDFR